MVPAEHRRLRAAVDRPGTKLLRGAEGNQGGRSRPEHSAGLTSAPPHTFWVTVALEKVLKSGTVMRHTATFLVKDRPLIQKWSHKIKTEPKNSYCVVTGARGDTGQGF